VIIGIVLVAALVAVFGWAAVTAKAYPRTPRGMTSLLVDLTWSLSNTVAGAGFLALNLLRHNRIDCAFSRGRATIGLEHGMIPGFATTIGPVQAGTGMNVDGHEAVHVFQARLLGPLYLPLVVLNYVVATLLPYWLIYHDHEAAPITNPSTYFMRGVYPHCWHEEWAYRVQGTPPRA
jgi:hypothetical protein